GAKAGFEAEFLVGGVVARDLVKNWDRYARALPQSSNSTAGSR
ncbi:purine nucleoside permease, partial [Caulobacter sp. D5]